MNKKDWLTTMEAADYIGVTKPQIFRLINEKKIIAKLNMEAPVPYYLIDMSSLDNYKKSPKNKGGRPKKKENDR